MNRNDQPLISLVILTRNRSDLVVRAIRSALGQTYPNTEIVIIDDVSTDGTVEILNKEFKDEIEKGKMRIIRNEKILGQAGNRNLSLEISKGELISYLDDDDFWFPDKVERQYEEIKKSGAVASTCGMVWIEGKKILKTTLVRSEKVSFENGGPPSTWLFQKEAAKKVGGFDPEFPANVDGEFLIKLNKEYGEKAFCYAEEPLYAHFYFPEQITADPTKKVKGWEMTIEKHGKDFNADEISAAYGKLAIFSLFAGKKKLEYPHKAFRARRSLKNLFLILIFILPSTVTKEILNMIMDIQKYPKSYISRYAKIN